MNWTWSYCDLPWPERDRIVTVPWPVRDRNVAVLWPERDHTVTAPWPDHDRPLLVYSLLLLSITISRRVLSQWLIVPKLANKNTTFFKTWCSLPWTQNPLLHRSKAIFVLSRPPNRHSITYVHTALLTVPTYPPWGLDTKRLQDFPLIYQTEQRHIPQGCPYNGINSHLEDTIKLNLICLSFNSDVNNRECFLFCARTRQLYHTQDKQLLPKPVNVVTFRQRIKMQK